MKRLDAIEAAGLADQFLTVSQAMYAYETAAGVRVDTGVLPPLRDFGQSEDGFQGGANHAGGTPLKQMVVSATGEMAMMRTLHPLDFIQWKATLPEVPSRRLQIEAVQQLWDIYLSTYMTGGSQ